MSIREQVVEEVGALSEAELKQVADYVAFLRFQGRFRHRPGFDEATAAAWRAEFGGEDRELAGKYEPEFSLDHLLAGVTEQNVHGEADFGPAVGKEVW
jgi:hypothetical protein